jgi:hypothetical protein
LQQHFSLLTSTSGGAGATYQWRLNGNIIGGAYTNYLPCYGNRKLYLFFHHACTTNVSNSIAITVNANCGTGLQYDGLNDYAIIPNNNAYSLGTGDFYD